MLFLLPSSVMADEKTKLNVAILPWKVNSTEKLDYIKDALYDMVSSRMAAEKHLAILKESSVKNVFSKYENDKITEDVIRKIGGELGADYVVYGSLTVLGETISLDARVISAKREEPPIQSTSQGRTIESLIPAVSHLTLDLNAKILEKEGLESIVSGFGASPIYAGGFKKKGEAKKETGSSDFIITTKDTVKEKQLWKSPTLPINLKRIAVADVDGDNRNEVILIDDHNLYIYRIRGNVMDMVMEFKGKVYEENFSVDVADINGNGVPEIYISRLSSKNTDSYVIEYQNGEFVKIAQHLPWFFKVSDGVYEETPVLIGQGFSLDRVFFKDIKHLIWDRGKLTEKANIDMPDGFNIYNSVRLPLGADKDEYVLVYTNNDILQLFKKEGKGNWQEGWTSKDYFGGSLNRITLETSHLIKGSDEPAEFINLKSRILYGDLDGDGNIEIIVNKNEPGTLSRYFKKIESYKKGEVADLSWENGRFKENWKTKTLDGYIADFTIKDFDNDGQKDLVIIVVDINAVTGAKSSYLIGYKLNIK